MESHIAHLGAQLTDGVLRAVIDSGLAGPLLAVRADLPVELQRELAAVGDDATLAALARRRPLARCVADVVGRRQPELLAVLAERAATADDALHLLEAAITAQQCDAVGTALRRLADLGHRDNDALFERLWDDPTMPLPGNIGETCTRTAGTRAQSDGQTARLLTHCGRALRQHGMLTDVIAGHVVPELRARLRAGQAMTSNQELQLFAAGTHDLDLAQGLLGEIVAGFDEAQLLGSAREWMVARLAAVQQQQPITAAADQGDLDTVLDFMYRAQGSAWWEQWGAALCRRLIGDRDVAARDASSLIAVLSDHGRLDADVLALRSWDHDFVAEWMLRRPEQVDSLDEDTLASASISRLNALWNLLRGREADVWFDHVPSERYGELEMGLYQRAQFLGRADLGADVNGWLTSLNESQLATAISLWAGADPSMTMGEFRQLVLATSSEVSSGQHQR